MTESVKEQQRLARTLAQVDPDISDLIHKETERQSSRLELIASENFTSEAILEAAGGTLTNKYAEGFPGKRYYGGGWGLSGGGTGTLAVADQRVVPSRPC